MYLNQNKMNQNVIARLIVSMTILLCSVNVLADPGYDLAPDFTLKSRSGDNLRLAEQRGNIVLVNFWASWCGPCREELPKMEALQQSYQDLGFTVLAINVDDNPAKAENLLRDVDVTFPVLFDPQGKVSQQYDLSAMPTTVIVDRDGNARLTHKGYKSGDEVKYEKAIKVLLRE